MKTARVIKYVCLGILLLFGGCSISLTGCGVDWTVRLQNDSGQNAYVLTTSSEEVFTRPAVLYGLLNDLHARVPRAAVLPAGQSIRVFNTYGITILLEDGRIWRYPQVTHGGEMPGVWKQHLFRAETYYQLTLMPDGQLQSTLPRKADEPPFSIQPEVVTLLCVTNLPVSLQLLKPSEFAP